MAREVLPSTRLTSAVTQQEEMFPPGEGNRSSWTGHVQLVNPIGLFSHLTSLL